MIKWHKGPPPSIGWWPASVSRDRHAIRWWNGKWWSDPAYSFNHIEDASKRATQKGEGQHRIEWTDRPALWPERSKT